MVQNYTQENNGEIINFCTVTAFTIKGHRTNMRCMDLGVFHDVTATEEIAQTGRHWFVSVFYTAFLGYPVAPTFSLCSMCCHTDGWSAATNQVLCGFEGGEKSMAPKCSHYAHVFFLLRWATLSDHCQREYRGLSQLVPWADAGLHCACSGRAKRTTCSLSL